MQTPTTAQLPEDLARAARACAETLRGAGHRAWIVGGAVRDLALGEPPVDVDLASAATPDEIEALFARTTAVGRAFGTVLVRLRGCEVQHTTFRTEGSYSDGRRPDAVSYGTRLEEDAARRDFTCNALYLDPLAEEVADPTGGLADLERGVLRCVGAPRERFREDGLRLLRMARFAARFDLAIEAETLADARQSVEALRGISSERTYAELCAMFEGRRPERALECMHECGLLATLLPGWAGLHPPGLDDAAAYELRRAAFRHLGGATPDLGVCRGLALLFDPSPRDPVPQPGDFETARALLAGLRAPRKVERCVLEHWRLGRSAEAMFLHGLCPRAERVRLVREEAWPSVARMLEAWCVARGSELAALEGLRAFGDALSPAQRSPEPLLTPADLEQAGVPPGPRWGRLLERAETAQLNGELESPDQARAWLREQLARG